VLGVGSAASIAEKNEFAAVADGRGGSLREFGDASDERVGKCLLDASAFRPTGAGFLRCSRT